MNDSIFEDLMEAIEDGEATAEQVARLSELISTNAEFRTRYLQYMAMRGQLAVSARRISRSEPENEQASAPAEVGSNRSRQYQRISVSLIAVAVSAVIIIFGYQQLTQDRGGDLSPTEGSNPDASIAVVEEQDGYWHCSGLNAEVGEPILAGRWLRLDHGTATVRFKNGVVMKMMGDTLLQIVSEKRTLLVHGEARTNVPDNATGFTVATAAADVVDLGTEFSVSTDGAKLDVQVHDGRARIDSAEMPSQMVNEGDTFRVDPVFRKIERVQTNPTANDKATPHLHIAYQIRPETLGNQAYPGKVGHDFVVHRPIAVTQLGVFDSASDGLNSPLTCELWRRDTGGTPTDFSDDRGSELLATVVFDPGQEIELSGAHRILPLKDGELILHPGSYSVVAFGFGTLDPNGNDWEAGWNRADKKRDDGEQAIGFVGTSRFGSAGTEGELDANSFPLNIDTVFADRYSAGTFEFRLVH